MIIVARKDFGMNQEAVAISVGKDRVTISNTLRLLRLPHSIKIDIVEGRLSTGHARALLMISDPSVQLHIRDIIIAQGLNVRDAEKLAGLRAGQATTSRKKKRTNNLSVQLNDIVEGFKRLFATQVRIKGTDKKGSLEIDYYSSEDLDRIVRIIRGEL